MNKDKFHGYSSCSVTLTNQICYLGVLVIAYYLPTPVGIVEGLSAVSLTVNRAQIHIHVLPLS